MSVRYSYTPEMRMKSGRDFTLAYSQGSRARGGSLLVVARENGLPHTRLGLSVGRRIWKSAVKRNRVRRVFREAFRLEYPELPKGVDLVLIPAEAGLRPRLADVRRELVRLSAKAHKRYLEKAAS